MSRNGGSDILVATVSIPYLLSIGLRTVLYEPSVKHEISNATTQVSIGVVKNTKSVITSVGNFVSEQKHHVIDYLIHHTSRTSPSRIPINPEPEERNTSSTPPKTNGNYPKSLLLIPECKHLENEEVDISQHCKDIYYTSLFAVKTEKLKTNNKASQERLYQISLQAGEKKRQELLVVASVTITTGTTVIIARAVVADSANRANHGISETLAR